MAWNQEQAINQKKGGRKRFKHKRNNMLEFGIRKRKNKKGCEYKRVSKKKVQMATNKKKINEEYEHGDSMSGKIQAEELLALGKDLGLDPIFLDNDTISIIMKRLKTN